MSNQGWNLRCGMILLFPCDSYSTKEALGEEEVVERRGVSYRLGSWTWRETGGEAMEGPGGLLEGFWFGKYLEEIFSPKLTRQDMSRSSSLDCDWQDRAPQLDLGCG
jgi:hypothetical protein